MPFPFRERGECMFAFRIWMNWPFKQSEAKILEITDVRATLKCVFLVLFSTKCTSGFRICLQLKLTNARLWHIWHFPLNSFSLLKSEARGADISPPCRLYLYRMTEHYKVSWTWGRTALILYLAPPLHTNPLSCHSQSLVVHKLPILPHSDDKTDESKEKGCER